MAAALLVSVQKLGGSPAENWKDFESFFRSLADVAEINADRRVDYLKLPLQDASLQFFFHKLCEETRNDLELRLKALQDHFYDPNLKGTHHMTLENLKSNNKTDPTEEFVVKLQNLALKAFLPPIDMHVEPLKENVANNQERVDGEHRKNEIRRIYAKMERDRDVVRLFKKAMANFIKLKLLEEPEKNHKTRPIYKKKTEKNSERILSRR